MHKLCSSAPLGSALHYSRRLPLSLRLYWYSSQWNLSWEVEDHDSWLQWEKQTLALNLCQCTGNIGGIANCISPCVVCIATCSLHSFLHAKSAGLGLQLMLSEHIEVLRPSGRNPGSQLYNICDPTSAVTTPTIEPFTGGVGSPQPSE